MEPYPVDYADWLRIQMKRKVNVDTVNVVPSPVEFADWLKLPTEMYLEIFSYLSYEHLKEAMIVCKHWYEVILPSFINRTALALEYCDISKEYPPRNILMNATRPFLHVKLGDKIDFMKAKNDVKFWKRIGEKATTLEINREFVPHEAEILNQILSYFTAMKTLKLYSKEILNIDQTFESVETIHFTLWEAHWSVLICLRNFPNLEKITASKISSGTLQHSEQLKILKEMRGVGTIEIHPVNFLSMEALQFKDVTKISGFPCSYALEKQKKFTSIRHIALSVYKNSSCFFHHEILRLESVKTVQLNFPENLSTKLCKECLEFLIESFPNLNSWEFTGHSEELSRFIDATPKPLKSLTMKFGCYIKPNSSSCCSLEEVNITHYDGIIDFSSWPIMVNLKKLTCVSVGSIVNFEQVFEKCPAVVDAAFNEISMQQFLQIADHWPYIKRLTINKFEIDFNARLHGIEGKFKSIRSITTYYLSTDRSSLTDLELFTKIPTLRQSFSASYDVFARGGLNFLNKRFDFPWMVATRPLQSTKPLQLPSKEPLQLQQLTLKALMKDLKKDLQHMQQKK